jgi:putative ABC transport system permease protein
VSPAYQHIKRWTVADGQYVTDEQVDRAERVIVIGETVRRQLFGDAPAVGEQVRASNVLFIVVGVLTGPRGTPRRVTGCSASSRSRPAP